MKLNYVSSSRNTRLSIFSSPTTTLVKVFVDLITFTHPASAPLWSSMCAVKSLLLKICFWPLQYVTGRFWINPNWLFFIILMTTVCAHESAEANSCCHRWYTIITLRFPTRTNLANARWAGTRTTVTNVRGARGSLKSAVLLLQLRVFIGSTLEVWWGRKGTRSRKQKEDISLRVSA